MPLDAGNAVEFVLRQYDLGAVLSIAIHGGTAGGTWKVLTERGEWLIRQRGSRTSSPEAIAFDHGLRFHLVENGFPTAAPVAARSGETYVRMEDRAYEAYPFIAGVGLHPVPDRALANAAAALRWFHRVGSACPRARVAPPLAQYATLGVSEQSRRMEDPRLLEGIYAGLAGQAQAQGYGTEYAVCREWLRRLRERLDAAAYEALPKALTHGDYTAANLLFDEQGQVCGVFDFDWARWAPRVRDLADGMYAIGARRPAPLQPGSIWSLTETADFDVARCVAWLRAYQGPDWLGEDELGAIPLAFAARWLSVRVEGMAKVAAEDRVRFCFRRIAPPLEWVGSRWGEVLAALAAP